MTFCYVYIVNPSFYPFPMSLIICFSIINIIDIFNEYIIKWSKTMPLPKFFLSPSATKLKTFDLFYNIDYIDRVQMIRPYNARSLRQWNCVYDKRSYWQNCKACEYFLIRRKPSANSSSYFSSSSSFFFFHHKTKWIFCLFLPFLLHLSLDFAWLSLTEHFSTQMTH